MKSIDLVKNQFLLTLLYKLILNKYGKTLKDLLTTVLYFLVFLIAEFEPVPEPVPVAPKPVRSRGKTPVTTRTSSRHSSKVKCGANISK